MKYIIEIEDEPFGRNDDPVIPHGMDELYRAKGFNSLVFDQFGLDKLIPLEKKLEETYRRGLDDAWKAARKIAQEWEENAETEHRIVIDDSIRITLDSMTASEAIAKLREYEQQKPDLIKVGDEVEWEGDKIIVTQTFTPNLQKPQLHGIGSNGSCYYAILIEDVKKTGRHFPEVADLLEAMKGEQRDCHTCKNQVASSIECVDCRCFGKWEPKGGDA